MELATQLLRLRNGSTPSLREALAGHWGLDYDQMLANRGGRCGNERFATNAQALKALHEACLGLVGRCIEGSPSRKARSDRKGPKALEYLLEEIPPRLEKTSDEMESVVRALQGEFIPPGGSGNPTRGQLEILPSGRNFYTVDPDKIPSRGAWETGVAMAEELQARVPGGHRRVFGNPGHRYLGHQHHAQPGRGYRPGPVSPGH